MKIERCITTAIQISTVVIHYIAAMLLHLFLLDTGVCVSEGYFVTHEWKSVV